MAIKKKGCEAESSYGVIEGENCLDESSKRAKQSFVIYRPTAKKVF